jgi:Mg2+ and Co2+ transporter CorA
VGTLNIITISIMVPTLVVSIFSMNVKIPWLTIRAPFWGSGLPWRCSPFLLSGNS